MLRVWASFQDTVEEGYYCCLSYNGIALEDQVVELGLRDGDTVQLWEEDCGYEPEAILIFNFHHPLDIMPRLWAKAISD